VSSFSNFEDVFHRVRNELKLPITVHVAETTPPAVVDTAAVVAFKPERVGHAVCLSDACYDALKTSRIPIEICPTSNLKTKAAASLAEHPFGRFFEEANSQHPLILCTDDAGVFNCSECAVFCFLFPFVLFLLCFVFG
jgi:adenosine deaminase